MSQTAEVGGTFTITSCHHCGGSCAPHPDKPGHRIHVRPQPDDRITILDGPIESCDQVKSALKQLALARQVC